MKRYRVKPGDKVDLSKLDPHDTSVRPGTKDEARDEPAKLTARLEELQELLFAQHKHRLLIVLQGIDTAGKDGTIAHVFQGVNPQGVDVISYKEPTEVELEHDYLWRCHRAVPGNGMIAIFNRSHYEDVLVVRVHGQITRAECARRYKQINDFERLLVEEGTTVLKFFLNISKDEQKKRLQARLADPRKLWKFRYTDLKERKLWDEYQTAFADMLEECSTDEAPWYVVPSNKKWDPEPHRRGLIVDTLEALKMTYPPSEIDPASVKLD